MPRKKKEEIDNDVKVNEIENDVNTDSPDTEAVDIAEEEIDNDVKVNEIENDVNTDSPDTEAVDIAEEEIDNDVKVNEIENDVDTDSLDTEANSINEMKLKIYNQEYTVSQLIEIKNKPKKTYIEKETINRFNELMFNYYRGIKHALLRECCGKVYTAKEVKTHLDEKGYKIIDIRMSRKSIRFDKTTVDTIIKYIEECEA